MLLLYRWQFLGFAVLEGRGCSGVVKTLKEPFDECGMDLGFVGKLRDQSGPELGVEQVGLSAVYPLPQECVVLVREHSIVETELCSHGFTQLLS